MTGTKCTDVTTIPQFTGTCWFNAILMLLFYSDRTRVVMLERLTSVFKKTTSEKKRKIVEMFLYIIKKQYYRVGKKNRRGILDRTQTGDDTW